MSDGGVSDVDGLRCVVCLGPVVGLSSVGVDDHRVVPCGHRANKLELDRSMLDRDRLLVTDGGAESSGSDRCPNCEGENVEETQSSDDDGVWCLDCGLRWLP